MLLLASGRHCWTNTERSTAMLIPLFALAFMAQGMYRAFNAKPTAYKPEFHRTWQTEVPGYPASKYARSLE
jgi:hypothetical protein